MANYVVTTRNADGSLVDRAYTANDRADLFKKLTADGVNAVRVREGTLGKKPRKSAASGAPSKGRGLIAAAIVILGVGAAVWYLMTRGGDLETPVERESKKFKVENRHAVHENKKSEDKEKLMTKEVKAIINEKAKEYITKPLTGNVIRVLGLPPLDPKDPDNVFRTRVAQDIASLLAITPGEHVPRILPFYFMFEDAEREEAEKNGQVYKEDGGNAEFITALKKWKIAILEKDSEAKIAAKENLLTAQLEILEGMEEGLTVNDTIRAAYEFRVQAAELRDSMVHAIKEVYEEERNIKNAREYISQMNKKLGEEGILPIAEFDVFGEETLEE